MCRSYPPCVVYLSMGRHSPCITWRSRCKRTWLSVSRSNSPGCFWGITGLRAPELRPSNTIGTATFFILHITHPGDLFWNLQYIMYVGSSGDNFTYFGSIHTVRSVDARSSWIFMAYLRLYAGSRKSMHGDDIIDAATSWGMLKFTDFSV